MRYLWRTAAGLCLTPLLGLGLLRGSEVQPGKGGKPPVPPGTSQIVPDNTEQSCGTHGTQINFVENPAEAAKKAKKEGKLVFVLHVSGNFEDPRFT